MEKRMTEKNMQKSYFDVLGLCCSSEVPLIENILKPLQGIKEVSVIVPSRTVIVVHDTLLISQLQIVKALNDARLEANIRVYGDEKHQKRWPSPYSIASGVLLLLSLLKYVCNPFKYLALGAVAVGAYPIILKAIVSVRNLRFDINILMLIAVIGTIVMNDYLEAGTIVFLFSIAEWLESRASHKGKLSLFKHTFSHILELIKANAVMSSLMNIAPQKAVIAETGEVVDADEVKINTILAVKAGEVIPIDGVVLDGTCEVDEKTLTGESFPVAKQKDSTIWAGTINLNGYISVKTTALAEDCVVAKMAKLVEEAQNSKTSVQRLIDKLAKFYTPVVIISTLVAVVPVALRVHNEKHWLHFALVVLVSACPCALILSTPVATFCAYTKAATSGLLIKGGEHLETLAKIKVVAFDKTGTITKGEFVVTHFQSLSDDIDLNTLLSWVSSVESKSSHPLASAVVDYGRSLSIEPEPEKVTEFENFPGEGICGKIEDRVVYIGNKKIAARAGSETVPILQGEVESGKTTGYIYSRSTPVGFFSLSDTCRLGVQEAIGQLKSLGIKSAMLTGDSQSAAMQAHEQVGRSLELVHAELLPEDKVKIISEFKKEGPTAMIGDGINDAPALAAADIGISMGISGSALASETGNIILMSNDIRKIPEAIKLARKARQKVVENIILSIMTKAAILGLAIGGYPLVWAAVVADVGTCLLVIFNSMLLLRRGHKNGEKCCRSSTKPHIHKNGCGSLHDDSSHHHQHENDHHHHKHDHHQHENDHHHEHDHKHKQEHHSHKSCFSYKTKKMSQPHKCNGTHVSSCHIPLLYHHHHHQHQHKNDQHEQHCHHQHDQHQHQHHRHNQLDQHPQKCSSQTSSSTHPPCSSNSSLGEIVNHCNEFHEHKHCHHGRRDKNQDGVQKHDTENNLILNAEVNHAVATNRHDNCLGHRAHGTEHCHNQNFEMVTDDRESHSSPCHLNHSCQKEGQQITHNHCHLIHGCENLKDNDSKDDLRFSHDNQHEKSGYHSDFEKHETGEISLDVISEHVESASIHGCSSLEEQEKGSFCEGCSDTCEKLPAVCGCESSYEREDSACCGNEDSSKERKESSFMHVCVSLNKREVGGCCKSYMKECCAKLGHTKAGFVGLSEIITEQV